ncbi:MAG: hypothetical protein ACLQD8_07755 [Thermoplasmata archaeon]
MTAVGLADSYLSFVTLREIRRYIVRSHAVMMSVFIGLVYALVSMTQSGMLVFAHLGGGYSFLIETGHGSTFQPWNFPGLLILAPWGIVDLPLFGLVSMTLVSIGVALGMAVAVLLAVSVARRRSGASQGPAALGALTGLTPAMIALLALGACCSTTAAASAGVGVIAQLSGSTTNNLLLNNWYLSVFQMAIVWVALIAQEALLRIYGGLFGAPDASWAGAPSQAPSRLDRWVVAGTAFRAALLIGGTTWSLAMFADWTTVAPGSAPAALWFDWIVVHQLPSVLAIVAALFPSATVHLFRDLGRSMGARGLRAAAGVAGALLIFGAPPPLSLWGIDGWGNELLAYAGGPTSAGAVAPHLGSVGALAFRWGFQYLLLGGVALVLALRPRTALLPLLWSTGAGPLRASAHPPEPDAAAPTTS